MVRKARTKETRDDRKERTERGDAERERGRVKEKEQVEASSFLSKDDGRWVSQCALKMSERTARRLTLNSGVREGQE